MIKKQDNIELYFWILALFLLKIDNPDTENISFCLFKFIGFDACIGCGIGRSLAYILDCRIWDSWNTHILGIPILLILLSHIFKLLRNIKIKNRPFYTQ